MKTFAIKAALAAAALSLAGAASAVQTYSLTNADGTLAGSVTFNAQASGLTITVTNLTAQASAVGATQSITGVVFTSSGGAVSSTVTCLVCDAKTVFTSSIYESLADGVAWAWKTDDSTVASTKSYLSALVGGAGGVGENGPDYAIVSASATSFGSSLTNGGEEGTHNPLYVGSASFSVAGNFEGYTFSDVEFRFNTDGMTVVAVPEPETYALMLAGLGAVAFMARRRKAKAA